MITTPELTFTNHGSGRRPQSSDDFLVHFRLRIDELFLIAQSKIPENLRWPRSRFRLLFALGDGLFGQLITGQD